MPSYLLELNCRIEYRGIAYKQNAFDEFKRERPTGSGSRIRLQIRVRGFNEHKVLQATKACVNATTWHQLNPDLSWIE